MVTSKAAQTIAWLYTRSDGEYRIGDRPGRQPMTESVGMPVLGGHLELGRRMRLEDRQKVHDLESLLASGPGHLQVEVTVRVALPSMGRDHREDDHQDASSP